LTVFYFFRYFTRKPPWIKLGDAGRRVIGKLRRERYFAMKWLFRNPFFRYGLIMGGLVFAIELIHPGLVTGLLSTDGFMPHYHCYMQDPRMVWLHVLSDTLIGLAYVSISSTLAYMVFKARRNIPFHWMFLAFGIFIVSCGFTHFMEVWTVWQAVYWLSGCIKVITAIASVTTAIVLFPRVPKVFGMIEAVKVSEERREKLLSANRELEAFASSISHDLRAPLRTMQGMALALKQDYGDQLDGPAKMYTNRIISASERMDRLIQDLLEYSRMTRMEFELIPLDLKLVVDEVLSMVSSNVQERKATIKVEGLFPRVRANGTLLNQVITNLLTNALKFVPTEIKPDITIQVKEEGKWVRMAIRDNGIGIAPQHQQRIFKIFERLHTATEYPGTGIGLAIVERAVVRMEGKLGLESQVGKGSTFWIELPKCC
jgi:signal transduction histidine kinase